MKRTFGWPGPRRKDITVKPNRNKGPTQLSSFTFNSVVVEYIHSSKAEATPSEAADVNSPFSVILSVL